MELTSASSEIDLWAEGIMARFRGNNYRRIGAVILTLVQNDVSKNKIYSQQRVIYHPNPIKPLPNARASVMNRGNSQRVVFLEDVEEFLRRGWSFVAKLSDDKAVVKIT